MGISLEKRAETVGIMLQKHNILKAPTVRAGLALDISGSAKWMYERGIIQETADRLLALAMQFDDNGELDMWTFTTEFDRLETATKADYNNYVKKNILDNRNVSKWGGTSYAPIMSDIVEFYFGETAPKKTSFIKKLFGKAEPVTQQDTSPAMVMFVTDGQCFDETEAARILRDAQQYPLYWQMVGVGDARQFRFLEEMADELPNVGYTNMASLAISDEKLYEQIVAEEFCEWVARI